MTGLLNPKTLRSLEETPEMDRIDVMVVDDDVSWAQSLADVLGEAGISVQTVNDPENALNLLEHAHPALVISDVHMPRIDGLELLRQFRQRDRYTPVLMISADDQTSVQDRAMREGANAFLRKPVSSSLLLRAVKRFLGAERVSPR